MEETPTPTVTIPIELAESILSLAKTPPQRYYGPRHPSAYADDLRAEFDIDRVEQLIHRARNQLRKD